MSFDKPLIEIAKKITRRNFLLCDDYPSIAEIKKWFASNKDPVLMKGCSEINIGIVTYELFQSVEVVERAKKNKNSDLKTIWSVFKEATCIDSNACALELEFDHLKEYIFLVNAKKQIVGWFLREELLVILLKEFAIYMKLVKAILNSLPQEIIAHDKNGSEIYRNEIKFTAFNSNESDVNSRQKIPLVMNGDIYGDVFVRYHLEQLEELLKETDYYQDMHMDMKIIFDNAWDVIYVTDGQGKTLRASKACEFLWGLKKSDLVGKSVYELEDNKIFEPSIARMVIEKGERVTEFQKTITGRHLLVVGTPIKDKSGNIIRVINTSRDITEQSNLQVELDRIRELSDRYKQELRQIQKKELQNIVSRSREMDDIVDLSKKAAQAESTILLTGETGVGKEVIAKAIHNWSTRKVNAFIQINCASIPENLLESELFGYQAGAFTGAGNKGKAGLVELSHEGTLFLDEIGELSLNLQAKLLRVLQDKTVLRVGGVKPIPIDMRVIASTNRNLADDVKNKQFREDLFYRLNVIPIHIPPLRQRRDDIMPLLIHFLHQYNIFYMKNISFSNDAFDILTRYSWPGNVRELQNITERVVVTAEKKIIESEDLPQTIRNLENQDIEIEVGQIIPLNQAIDTLERKMFALAVLKYSTTTDIAKALGINQSTVSRKLSKFGIKCNKI